jgi:hypothetical protein
VVAGDGTGDRLLVAGAKGPVAWRPGRRHVLGYVSEGRVRAEDVDSGRILWRKRLAGGSSAVRALVWSSDGRDLLVLQPFALRVYDANGDLVARDDPSDATQDVDAAFVPGSRRVAVLRRHGAQSTVFWLASGRALFSGTGTFDQLTFAPSGRELLVTWPTADQWVFVRVGGTRKRIRGVSNVSEQFRAVTFPSVEGWVP